MKRSIHSVLEVILKCELFLFFPNFLEYDIIKIYEEKPGYYTIYSRVVLSPLAPIGKQIHISSPQ